MAKAKDKIVRQMVREEFESVKLNGDQKKSLMNMVDSKYPQMVQVDQQIAPLIPANQVKSLQRAFRNAKRDGSTEVEAMSMSMQKIGLPEMIQKKVLMMNQSKTDIRASIRDSIAGTFDQEQQAAFATAMAAKKEVMGEEMTGDKEMMEKEMAGEKEMAEKEMTGEKEMMDENEKEMAGEKKMTGEEKSMDKDVASTSS